VFLSVFVSIRLAVWFLPEGVCRTVRVGVADCPHEGWTVRATRVSCGPSEDQVRIVRVVGGSSGHSVAFNGPSARG
jgi:hypothetical protein